MPKRVLIVGSMRAHPFFMHQNYPDASNYLRIASYLNDLMQDLQKFSIELVPFNSSHLSFEFARSFDVIWTNRYALYDCGFQLADIAKYTANGGRIILDLDDDLLNIDNDHPEAVFYLNRRFYLLNLVEKSSRLIVSTQRLKMQLSSVISKRRIEVIHNAVDPTWWPVKDKSRELNVVYYGTATHALDWHAIESDVINAVYPHSSFCRVLVCGLRPLDANRRYPSWVEYVEAPLAAKLSYRHFCAFVAQTLSPDLLLVPLRDTMINDSKSALKCLEGQAMGAAIVASSGFEHDQLIRSGVDLQARPGDWRESIEISILRRLKTRLQPVQLSRAFPKKFSRTANLEKLCRVLVCA